jgi:hypothetical protein
MVNRDINNMIGIFKKIQCFNVAETIKITKALIETEASLSLDLKEALDQLLYVTTLMFDRLTLDSSNSINNLDSTRDRWGWCKDEAAWLYASRASGKNRN